MASGMTLGGARFSRAPYMARTMRPAGIFCWTLSTTSRSEGHQQERNRIMPTGSASQRPVHHAKLLTNPSRPIASPPSVLSREICVTISCFPQSPFATSQYSCASLLPSTSGKLFCYAKITRRQLHPHLMFFTYFPT